MDHLWAPWREGYLTQVIKRTRACVFCRIAKAKRDKANYIFIRRDYCYAVLNIFPYNNGHSLVLPYRHVGDLDDLREEEQRELLGLLIHTKNVLSDVLCPEGFNIGMNMGHAAGAGVPRHIHFHIVPRWKGDVNFMPVINETKVISQSLKVLYDKLVMAQRKRTGCR